MIFKLLNPTTALAIGTISDYNLHSAYHNMRLHVLEQDYLQFLLLLQRTSSVHQNALRAMSQKSQVQSFQDIHKEHYNPLS